MPDVFTPAKRSEVMSRIRGKGNKATELVLAGLFRSHGIKGWRRHYAIQGRPDFAFPKLRVAVFVDGCFWHGCPTHATAPASNRAFWATKLAANKKRDQRVNRELRVSGWRIARIWEHDLHPRRQEAAIRRVLRLLASPSAP